MGARIPCEVIGVVKGLGPYLFWEPHLLDAASLCGCLNGLGCVER